MQYRMVLAAFLIVLVAGCTQAPNSQPDANTTADQSASVTGQLVDQALENELAQTDQSNADLEAELLGTQ